MDYETYRKNFFVEPQPLAQHNFTGTIGVALFFEEYETAVDFYRQVLGPPAYVEGDSTNGWRIGQTWLTLFPSKKGNPQNAEVQFMMATPADAEKLQRAFIAAGATGPAPSNELMYEPIRYCSITDPFGTELIITSRLRTG